MPYFSPVNCKDCKYERLHLRLCTGAKTPSRANFASLTGEILRPHEESQFCVQKGVFYFSS